MACLLISFVFLLVSQSCEGFYLPRNYKHQYVKGDEVFLKVNSLTSINTQLPLSYYSLPYCIPPWGIRNSAQNLGQTLMGDQILNSPYRFKMNINESIYLCTTRPLSADEVELLKQRTRDMYQVNMMLDTLPLLRYASRNGIKIQWTGFPVGYTDIHNNDYLINHLKFRVHVHEEILGSEEGYEIVGVEVVPCSIKYDPEKTTKRLMYDHLPPQNCPFELKKSQIIREGERVSYTYEVEFVKSKVKWESRWDAYLVSEDTGVHWFSIFNSLMSILLLAGAVLYILRNTVGAYGTRRYEELSKEDQQATEPETKEEIPGWRLIIGDVFREPGQSKLLCVMVGTGVQITGTAIVTVVLALLGFMSPASRGTMLLVSILMYHFFGITSGYAGVRLWSAIRGSSEEWKSVSSSISCLFPGIIFIVLSLLDLIYRVNHSTGAIPMNTYIKLLALWLFISVPLTRLGGYLAALAETIPHPVDTNHVPREITSPRYRSWLLVLIAGSYPFSTLFIQLFFIFSSFWLGRFYHAFGFLFIVLVLLVVVSALVSVVLTYMCLRAEDWKWWWKAFFASGSAGLFIFSYCINYLFFDLRGLNGPASATLYLGYSLIISVAVTLSTGAIGFLTSFYFVQYLYSSLNIDGVV